jgi:hypothetical protein
MNVRIFKKWMRAKNGLLLQTYLEIISKV